MPLPTNYGGSNMAHPWGVAITSRGAELGLTPRTMTVAYIHKQTFTDPVAASTTAIIATALTSTNLPNATTITYLPGNVLLDGTLGALGIIATPRNLVMTVGHASSIVAISALITGKDLYGKTITETFTITATGTSKAATGNVAFASITSIAITSAGNATTDTLILGTENKLGLEFPAAVASLVKEVAVGVVVTNGTLAAASASANTDARGTYIPNTNPDGVNDYSIYYLVDNPNGF